MKRAAEKLVDVDEPPTPVAAALDALVAVSAEISNTRVESAIAGGAAPYEVVKALEHLATADERVANNEPVGAIDEYKKAWEGARDGGSYESSG